MAVCGKIYKGQDISCGVTQKGYAQEVVLVNLDDFEEKNITVECEEATSKYRAAPVLKTGAKGVKFIGPAAGNALRVIVEKTRTDYGFAQYRLGINMLMAGVTEEQKCILSSLDKGRVVAFVKLSSYDTPLTGMVPAIEIVGLVNGLTTNDYTSDITEGGGIVQLELRTPELTQENDLPYIYESTVPGSELADFDALFENV